MFSPITMLQFGGSSRPPPARLSRCSSLLPLLTLVFCCDVVELGTYGKLKYYHSMTEEGKDERLHWLLSDRRRRHSSFSSFSLAFQFACLCFRRFHRHQCEWPWSRHRFIFSRSHLSVCFHSRCLLPVFPGKRPALGLFPAVFRTFSAELSKSE